MATHFLDSLRIWHPLRQQHQWALGAVVETQGSVYRKAGALMLLSEAGHQLGLLSGGCLESDLLLQARKVIALNSSRRVVYDATDEEGIAWKLGIGCGGRADILLQPCNRDNDYLKLESVLATLEEGAACDYKIQLSQPQAVVQSAEKRWDVRVPGKICSEGSEAYLQTLITPPPHLLIFGSGVDIVPLVQLAGTMGWRITLVDQRLTPQKKLRFPTGIATEIAAAHVLHSADAAIVAYHNMQLDAQAIVALQQSSCRYIGLLGPVRRKYEVLALGNLTERDLSVPVAGPAGLALGGDLPESVALSMLAEIHAVLFGSTGRPLNQTYLS